MKLPLLEKQIEAFELQKHREFFALFAEQGTGKSVMALADLERVYLNKDVNAALIIAPNGVHRNWALREIPKHLDVAHIAIPYVSGRVYFKKAYEAMMKSSHQLKILCMSIDSAVTNQGFDLAASFLRQTDAWMSVDESQRIKNPKSKRTKMVSNLGRLAIIRRISTGTAATNAPHDVFSQMQFLQKGLLGTNSYRAFVAQYTRLIPDDSALVKSIMLKTRERGEAAARSEGRAYHHNDRIPPPQLAVTDRHGNKIYQNLDELHALLAPHSFRVLKKECMDLPDKIYEPLYFELDPKQRTAYTLLKEELRIERDNGMIEGFQKLSIGTKLQQITSGFIMARGDVLEYREKHPRIELLAAVLEDLEGQFIIWAKFTAEIEAITKLLRKLKIKAAAYYGKTPKGKRDEIIDGFQAGEIRAFVGQAKAGGTGLTLTNADVVIYYSSDFSLEDRLQSEDRNHRYGTTEPVLYIDLIAENSIDEKIHAALHSKGDMAKAIMGELD